MNIDLYEYGIRSKRSACNIPSIYFVAKTGATFLDGLLLRIPYLPRVSVTRELSILNDLILSKKMAYADSD